MRIEYDRNAMALYVHLADGEQAETVEVQPMKVYVDIDAEGRTLGIEFLTLEAFGEYIREHGGMNFPERFAGPQSLVPA
jgi:uncharacterized protein YuzE